MMDFVLLADWKQWIIGPAMFFIASILILLVLVQRGRGGGLAGALGGPGGQSAFGTKAGDIFTRITVGIAAVWILLCVLAVGVLQDRTGGNTKLQGDDSLPPVSIPSGPGPGLSPVTPGENPSDIPTTPTEPMGSDSSANESSEGS